MEVSGNIEIMHKTHLKGPCVVPEIFIMVALLKVERGRDGRVSCLPQSMLDVTQRLKK